MTKFVCSDGFTRDLPVGTFLIEEDDDVLRWVTPTGATDLEDTYEYSAEDCRPHKTFKEIPMPTPVFDLAQYVTGWHVGIFKSGAGTITSQIFRYRVTSDSLVSRNGYHISENLVEVVGPVKYSLG